MSVIDGATCNARRQSGCPQTPVTLSVPGGPDGLAVNEATNTLFTANNGPGARTARSNTVSIVDTSRCNARNMSGCAQQAPTALTGANPAEPTVDEATNTVYVPTFDDALTIIDAATCNAVVRTGCGQTTPSAEAGIDAFSIAIDGPAHTAYVGDFFQLSVLDTSTCNPTTPARCAAHPATVPLSHRPYGVAVNPSDHTVYVSGDDGSAGTVSVIDGTRCSAGDSSGCGEVAATVTVGREAAGLAVNAVTGTVYVASVAESALSVIDGRACHAGNTSGCAQTPARVPVTGRPLAVATNQATNTIYVLSPGRPGTVSVIDGATCNAADTSGCDRRAPTVTVGNDADGGSEGLAANEITNTVYVVNTGDDTVSVIDGSTCNRTIVSGCDQRPTQVSVGRLGRSFVAVDPDTNRLFVSNTRADSVSIIDGAACNGSVTSGCGATHPAVPAGASPAGVAVDPTSHALYAADSGSGPVSFFEFTPPRRPAHVTASAARGRVNLAWEAPFAGGLPLTYRIVPTPRCAACRGLDTAPTSPLTTTTIDGLTRGRTYTFRLQATNAAGTGPRSNPSNPVTP